MSGDGVLLPPPSGGGGLPGLNLKTEEVLYLEREVIPLVMGGMQEVLLQSKREGSNTRDFRPLQYLAAFLKIKNPRTAESNRRAYNATLIQSLGRSYLARRRVKAIRATAVRILRSRGADVNIAEPNLDSCPSAACAPSLTCVSFMPQSSDTLI